MTKKYTSLLVILLLPALFFSAAAAGELYGGYLLPENGSSPYEPFANDTAVNIASPFTWTMLIGRCTDSLLSNVPVSESTDAIAAHQATFEGIWQFGNDAKPGTISILGSTFNDGEQLPFEKGKTYILLGKTSSQKGSQSDVSLMLRSDAQAFQTITREEAEGLLHIMIQNPAHPAWEAVENPGQMTDSIGKGTAGIWSQYANMLSIMYNSALVGESGETAPPEEIALLDGVMSGLEEKTALVSQAFAEKHDLGINDSFHLFIYPLVKDSWTPDDPASNHHLDGFESVFALSHEEPGMIEAAAIALKISGIFTCPDETVTQGYDILLPKGLAEQ